MNKKCQWYQKPSYITAIIALVGSLAIAIVTMSDYIRLPSTTEALAGQIQDTSQRVNSIEEYIKVQQRANELNQQWQQQQQQQWEWQQRQPNYHPQPYQQPNYQAPEYQLPPPRDYRDYEGGAM